MTKSTGDALKALLKAGQAVYVSMDWTDALPRKQKVRADVCVHARTARTDLLLLRGPPRPVALGGTEHRT